jgi:hypothetical protein
MLRPNPLALPVTNQTFDMKILHWASWIHNSRLDTRKCGQDFFLDAAFQKASNRS